MALAPLVARVPEAEAGSRLDLALARLFPEHSRSRLQSWIEAGRVRLDGLGVTRPKHRLKGGEAVLIEPEAAPETLAFLPEVIPLVIVYEDASLLVLDKPAGLVVHPASGNWSGTLLNALLAHDPALASLPRAGIVHRLDKDTSGLMVVAKTLAAQTHLVRQLQDKRVYREYQAVALGDVPSVGTVAAPIGRHPKNRLKMAVVPEGKAAVTHFRTLERFGGAASLVQCRLETGRTHQIRVHLMHLGHPLLGDPLYGKKTPNLPEFPRQALHALKLGLVHPESGAGLQWASPLPEDFCAVLERLRAR